MVTNGFMVCTNLMNIQAAAAGIWTVRISNAATAVSQLMPGSNAYLTVVVPPTNQIVGAGVSVRFTAAAASSLVSGRITMNSSPP